MSEKDAVGRMLRGFRAAEARQRELIRAEGPRPEQAVAEAIAASAALAAAGTWPGPRDAVSEREVERVRYRWKRIAQNAKQALVLRHSLLGTLLRISVAAGAGTLLISGCGDSMTEKLEKLSERCALNSDCEGDLVCVFERCHEACEADEDCADVGMRCVRGSKETNVCQLPDEVGCERDEDCPGEQVCGVVDQECRDACEADAECVGGQICAPSKGCASTDPLRDRFAGAAAGGAAGGGGFGKSYDEPDDGVESSDDKGRDDAVSLTESAPIVWSSGDDTWVLASTSCYVSFRRDKNGRFLSFRPRSPPP